MSEGESSFVRNRTTARPGRASFREFENLYRSIPRPRLILRVRPSAYTCVYDSVCLPKACGGPRCETGTGPSSSPVCLGVPSGRVRGEVRNLHAPSSDDVTNPTQQTAPSAMPRVALCDQRLACSFLSETNARELNAPTTIPCVITTPPTCGTQGPRTSLLTRPPRGTKSAGLRPPMANPHGD